MPGYDDSKVVWKPQSRRVVFKTKVLDILELDSESPGGETRDYTLIDAPDWVTVIPVLAPAAGGDCERFVMVRQWRHGENRVTVEFPGGVMNPGETAFDAAKRELLEETGYEAGQMIQLAAFSPNPALMTNHQHFFLALNLIDTKKTSPDDDEFIDVLIEDAETVFCRMESGEYSHGLMTSGAFLYLRWRQRSQAMVPKF
ncbi:MAG: NUDIX hydrolase [Treponemataceae bacterium]|nr:MAG: NUDIX hydrolase [Treponemataceae bacterium]